MQKPRLLVFASGTPNSGGSGARNLVLAARSGILEAEIVGFVSNHADGGVARHAEEMGIPFLHMPQPWSAEHYQVVVDFFKPDFIALSGWLKPVLGLDQCTTFNIHPTPLPRFGGKGMYGKKAHAAVLEAYKRGEITHSAVTMHFVTEEYDRGPIFFEYQVPIYPDDTVETLAKRVNEAEHKWQPIVTDMVIHGQISWDGMNSVQGSLRHMGPDAVR